MQPEIEAGDTLHMAKNSIRKKAACMSDNFTHNRGQQNVAVPQVLAAMMRWRSRRWAIRVNGAAKPYRTSIRTKHGIEIN